MPPMTTSTNRVNSSQEKDDFLPNNIPGELFTEDENQILGNSSPEVKRNKMKEDSYEPADI